MLAFFVLGNDTQSTVICGYATTGGLESEGSEDNLECLEEQIFVYIVQHLLSH